MILLVALCLLLALSSVTSALADPLVAPSGSLALSAPLPHESGRTASWDRKAAEKQAKELSAVMRAVWEETRDPEKVTRALKEAGFVEVGSANQIGSMTSDEIRPQSTASNITLSFGVLTDPRTGNTVITGYYDWVDNTWDSMPGGYDKLWLNFARALGYADDGSSRIIFSECANYDNYGGPKSSLITLTNFREPGCGLASRQVV